VSTDLACLSVPLAGSRTCGLTRADEFVISQPLSGIHLPDTPPVLTARGGFFLGGDAVQQSYVQLGSRRPADQVTIKQMYVESMVPAGAPKTPVVIVHGAGSPVTAATPRRTVAWAVRVFRSTFASSLSGRPGGTRALGIQSCRIQRRRCRPRDARRSAKDRAYGRSVCRVGQLRVRSPKGRAGCGQLVRAYTAIAT
jgi:hypothetical protein